MKTKARKNSINRQSMGISLSVVFLMAVLTANAGFMTCAALFILFVLVID